MDFVVHYYGQLNIELVWSMPYILDELSSRFALCLFRAALAAKEVRF
jgi:hypothetical protein